MKKKEVNILAVNPGTKYVGLAVFHGSDLVYWGIKVLKGKWSKEKMKCVEKTLLNLIDQHSVTTLVIKKVDSSRTSRNLNALVESIEQCVKERKLKVCPYTLSELKKFLALGNRINKMEIAGLAVARYQFLIHQLERERKHKHPYFVRMFEAIAAGILAFNRLKR
jgi:RNase H-fold protein (predicted Holliday junction resolvase)